jgi:hypothetical protein
MNNETEIQFSNSKTPGVSTLPCDCDSVTVTAAIVLDSKLLPHQLLSHTPLLPLSLERKDVMKMFTFEVPHDTA